MTRIFKPDSGQVLEIQDEGGSAALTIETDGNVTVDAGNLAIGTAGKGIDFSATSDASGMTSELLDDYEEGTWTPVLATASDDNATQDGSVGSYVKIGKQITCVGYLAISALNDVDGDIRVKGLPFTSQATNARGVGVFGYASGMNLGSSDEYMTGYVPDSQAYMALMRWTESTGTAYMSSGAWSNDGAGMMIITYHTA